MNKDSAGGGDFAEQLSPLNIVFKPNFDFLKHEGVAS